MLEADLNSKRIRKICQSREKKCTFHIILYKNQASAVQITFDKFTAKIENIILIIYNILNYRIINKC